MRKEKSVLFSMYSREVWMHVCVCVCFWYAGRGWRALCVPARVRWCHNHNNKMYFVRGTSHTAIEVHLYYPGKSMMCRVHIKEETLGHIYSYSVRAELNIIEQVKYVIIPWRHSGLVYYDSRPTPCRHRCAMSNKLSWGQNLRLGFGRCR